MGAVLFIIYPDTIGTMYKSVDFIPQVGESVYLNGTTYDVEGVKHFPEWYKKGIPEYKKHDYPFVRVMLKQQR